MLREAKAAGEKERFLAIQTELLDRLLGPSQRAQRQAIASLTDDQRVERMLRGVEHGDADLSFPDD